MKSILTCQTIEIGLKNGMSKEYDFGRARLGERIPCRPVKQGNLGRRIRFRRKNRKNRASSRRELQLLFLASVSKMGTLCTRTLYTHPEPCTPPTYFILKTFLANFRVLREREIWSGISEWATDSGTNSCPKCSNAKRGFPRDRPETFLIIVSGLSRGKPLFAFGQFWSGFRFPSRNPAPNLPFPQNPEIC